jgi:acetoin utilization deacetylase AcuC-like enzyme
MFIASLFIVSFSNVKTKNLKTKEQNQTILKKFPIIFHERYDISFLGIENLHPFDSKKYGKVFKNLQKSLSLKKDQFYKPNELDLKDLELVHSKEYLN